MNKLSFEVLQQKAAATNQEELLTSVSGGTFGDCHCGGHSGWGGVGAATIDHLFNCDSGSDFIML